MPFFLPFLFAVASAVQTPAIPRAGETIEVSIINVDVVVTDRKGNHVHGLTKDDFEIYENRKLQPVSNFFEYRDGHEAVPVQATISTEVPHPVIESAPRPKRTILVFIDHFSLAPARKAQFFGSLKTLLHQVVGTGDAVSIVSWNMLTMASTRLPFTDNLASVDMALNEIEDESTFVTSDPRSQTERERLWRAAAEGGQRSAQNSAAGDAHEEEANRANALLEKMEMRRKIKAIRSLATGISAFEGKKVLLFVTSRFSRIAGGRGSEAHGRDDNDNDYDMFTGIEALGMTAATNNVTIYPLYPPGLAENTRSAESPTSFNPGAMAAVDLENQLNAMNLIAERTGGATAWGVENIAEFLPKVREDLDSYYSLAYRATSNGNGRDRSLTVKMKNREYTARSRRDYIDKSPAMKMKDRVIASLFREPSGVTIPITVTAGEARKESQHRWMVPVHVQIPIASLTALPKNDQSAGAFSVYVAWGGVLGEMSDVTRQTQAFSIPRAKQAEAKNGHYNYDFPLEVDERSKSVVVGVFDEVSQEFGILKIDLPPRT
jgi:VWFA-related protein